VGLKAHDNTATVELKVGEGVIKGNSKYLLVGIRYIVGCKSTKITFVKIPDVSSATSTTETPNLFEQKLIEVPPSKLTELEVEISKEAQTAVSNWLKASKGSKYPEGIDPALEWLTKTPESRMEFLELKIESALQKWKTGEEATNQKPMSNEVYQAKKKIYLDFLHHPQQDQPTQDVNSEPGRSGAQRKRNTVKQYQEEFPTELPSKRNRKEEKQHKDKGHNSSHHLREESPERKQRWDRESELENALVEKCRLEEQLTALGFKKEEFDRLQLEFMKTREKLARVEGENAMMLPLYNFVINRIVSGDLGFR